MEITFDTTVAEAIEEIKNKLYLGTALSTGTMLLALAALKVYEEDYAHE